MSMFRAGMVLSLVDRMTRPLARAQDELNSFERRAQRVSERLDRLGQGMSQAGQSMAIAGGALTAGYAFPVKFAADFQDSMADVNKVADFTKQEYDAFSSTLLDMSERIPMAAGELSQLAAAGGQMGIPKSELAEYTEMVSKLGVAFDMPAGQIGDTMGKLANVFDLPMNKVGLLGDAVNHLSNNMAAAAPGIVNALSRVGGTAANLGLAAEQTAALSSTLIAQGEAPERAGTAMNRLLVRLSQINTQSKSAQEAFSELGFNASDFSERMRKDPLPAIMDFLERAKESGKAGEYMSRVLGEEAGPKIVKLANNMDKLKASLGMVAEESNYAGSAQEEFQARVDTFNSQMQLLWNTVKRVGITLGTIFLPPLTATAKAISAVISPMAKFAEKHKILSGAIFGTIGVLGIFTLVAGGVLMLLGSMANGLSAILALQGQGLFFGFVGGLRSMAARLGAATSATWSWIAAQAKAAAASGVWRMSMRTLAITIGRGVVSGFKRAALAARAFSAALLTNPLTWIAAAAVGAAVLIYKYWDRIRAFFGGFFRGLGEGLAPLLPLFKGLWSAVKMLVSPIAKLFSWLGELLAPAEATEKQLSGVAEVGRTVGKVFSWLFAPITGVAWLLKMLPTLDLGTAFGYWSDALSGWWSSLTGWLSSAWEKIKEVSAAVMSTITRVVTWPFRMIARAVRAVGSAVASAGQWIAARVAALWDRVTGLFSAAWGRIKSAAASALSGFKYAVLHPFETIKNAFLKFSPAAWIARGLDKLTQHLFGFSLFDAGKNILNSLWEGMKSLASKPVDMIKNVASKIRDFLPFSPAKTGPLTDIHKTGGALMKTMASGIHPAPVARRMQAALAGAKKAVPAAALSASVAMSPALAGASPAAYPEITGQARPAGSAPIQISLTFSPEINVRGEASGNDIEQALETGSRELEEAIYDAVTRALERRRRGSFTG